MKILVIGGGGREHAVGWALARSPRTQKLWFAPGNGGTAQLGENLPLAATDLTGILDFCRAEKPDLVAVLPDDPLALGLVDLLERHGFAAFGPTRAAAQIEASKAFAKAFMHRHGIPTAQGHVTEGREAALAWAESCPLPVVVKADGLALGKGVVICHTREEAREAVQGLSAAPSGKRLLFEAYLEGPEVTQLCFVSGQTLALMPACQDHKRAFDGDLGPNTGGMGAFSPVSAYGPDLAAQCMDAIFLPTLRGLAEEGMPFKGVLYFSLMLTADGPKVIEYNARFGDPEAQTLLPLLESDLLEIMLAVREERLGACPVVFRPQASCCVTLASAGYPGPYAKGLPIAPLPPCPPGGYIFHAGTKEAEGGLFTAGGRVLSVGAVAGTLREAIARAYALAGQVDFEGCFFRRDIGAKDGASR